MEAFDNTIKDYTSWLENPYVSGALTIFLIVYASMAAPKLPSYIANLFDYTLFKLMIFFLIVYVSKKNAAVALVASVALMVSIMTLDRLKFGQEMMDVVGKNESKKIQLGNCVCNCSSFHEIMPEMKTEEGKAVVAEVKKATQEGVITPKQAVVIAMKVAETEKVKAPVLVAKTEAGAKKMEELVRAERKGEVTPSQAKGIAAKIVAVEEIIKQKQEESRKLPIAKVASPEQLKHLVVASATAKTPEEHAQLAGVHARLAEEHTKIALGEHRVLPAEHKMEERRLVPTHEANRSRMEERRLMPTHEATKSRMEEHRMEERRLMPTHEANKPRMAEMAEEVMRRKHEEIEKHGVEPTPEELRRICAGVLDDFRKTCVSCGRGSSSPMPEITGHDVSASSHASI